MKGYFARKPENIKVVMDTIGEAKRAGFKPVEITPIAVIQLDAGQYEAFCQETLNYWDFLKPYADQSTFTGDHTADCVIVEAEGRQKIAVCLEGYSYPRYVAAVLEGAEKPNPKELPALPEERHICSLENNGACIRKPDGSTEPVCMEFYRRAVALCEAGGFNAVTYNLVLPGIEGEFMLSVWRNGHVDSGSANRIRECLDR